MPILKRFFRMKNTKTSHMYDVFPETLKWISQLRTRTGFARQKDNVCDTST